MRSFKDKARFNRWDLKKALFEADNEPKVVATRFGISVAYVVSEAKRLGLYEQVGLERPNPQPFTREHRDLVREKVSVPPTIAQARRFKTNRARRRFKTATAGQPCENELCTLRHRPGELDEEGNRSVCVAEHIVPASWVHDIACDHENMARTHGCVNLDEAANREARRILVARHFPHKLAYYDKHAWRVAQ